MQPGMKNFTRKRGSGGPPPSVQSQLTTPISCDRSNERYDFCSLNGPSFLDPTTSTFLVVDSSSSTRQPISEKVRPYPRKWEKDIMSHIKELILTSSGTPISTPCDVWHNAPALVFSAGGYTGNLFHDFNDGFIPLFVTVTATANSLVSDRNLVLVIANSRNWWLTKYVELLSRFTNYPIINLDNETATHCFPSASVGLISHGYMTIDPTLLPHSETFLNFRTLLEAAYVHGQSPPTARPRLVLVSRSGGVGRVIRNQDEIARAAEETGFEVSIFEPTQYTSLSEAYGLINGSHAMIGVHGAALTHSLFLRPGSVFVQVVPLGIDWLAETCFGKSARDMGLEYMEYKIRVEESSLVEKYKRDDLVLKNPKAVVKEAWLKTKEIYLKDQDVKLDLARFGKYLNKAFKKAKRFMDKEASEGSSVGLA
ncbi:hypothetical protein HHK36_032108 [Tetracentron sinense]|uniref:Glycosyltransferase 61 catalytic domain-containing protein n=1 Tax=Tetracentron sinense TaxID=13715 RepID=A0A834Y9Q6_TETSI|nr:hypothetical protein HHK36_032108 [Tetracentron sinense]